MSSFGSRLRERRKAVGLTQEQLGAAVGLQKSAVAKYENDKIVNVSTEVAEKFACALGISATALLSSFESGLYAMDYKVVSAPEGVWVSGVEDNKPAFFSYPEWVKIKESNDFAAVYDAVYKNNKKTPDTLIDIESLSEDKKALVDYVMSLSDAEARVLRGMFAAKPQSEK
jgi:transcriptional regulator with XRE-family HTH domain